MESKQNKGSILLATLGGQPQIVTFALDQLLSQGELIKIVHLVYLEPNTDRLKAAKERLLTELRTKTKYKHLSVVQHPILLNKRPIFDVQQTADAAHVWEFVNNHMTNLKRAGHHLHVLISGGRRILGMLIMSASALHFYSDDKLWHIYTPDKIQIEARDGRMMHLPKNSGFQLIQVPMLPLGSLFVGLRDFPHFDQKRALLDEQTERRCLSVLDRLTRRQKDVLAEFAAGHRPMEVAQSLSISINTINSHKSRIFDYCREAWEMEDGARLDYHFLATMFRPFFN